MLTTGGGWQDQVGGLTGGVKLVTTGPGLPQQIRITPGRLSPEAEVDLATRLVLVYTGQQRLAKNLLRAIMGRWMARDPEMVWLLRQIGQLAQAMRYALEAGDLSCFGALLSEHWTLNKRMDPGCTNPFIDELFDLMTPYIAGAKLAGAGGGGFVMAIARDAAAVDELAKTLAARYPGTPVRVWPCAVPREGLQIQWVNPKFGDPDVMKTALVCGAGGFIAGHLVKKLKNEGYWVRGVDIKRHEYAESAADEFKVLDLREPANCREALALGNGTFDEVYQLAADMGGMGFIHSAECEIMHNSVLINVHMIDNAARMGVPRYFYSSSVCVYRDMQPGEPEMTEAQAVPANPDNEYGWEKLYSERMLQAYGRKYGMVARIARFQNCYGPEGTWTGGREKAPAAICRKVAEVPDGGTIQVWGDGTAVRSYTYVSDMVRGIYLLMHSDLEGAVNIGSPEYVTVKELVETTAEVAGKRINVEWVKGPVGVQSRNFSNERIYSLGWRAEVSLKQGIAQTYPWIDSQVRALTCRGRPGGRAGLGRLW